MLIIRELRYSKIPFLLSNFGTSSIFVVSRECFCKIMKPRTLWIGRKIEKIVLLIIKYCLNSRQIGSNRPRRPYKYAGGFIVLCLLETRLMTLFCRMEVDKRQISVWGPLEVPTLFSIGSYRHLPLVVVRFFVWIFEQYERIETSTGESPLLCLRCSFSVPKVVDLSNFVLNFSADVFQKLIAVGQHMASAVSVNLYSFKNSLSKPLAADNYQPRFDWKFFANCANMLVIERNCEWNILTSNRIDDVIIGHSLRNAVASALMFEVFFLSPKHQDIDIVSKGSSEAPLHKLHRTDKNKRFFAIKYSVGHQHYWIDVVWNPARVTRPTNKGNSYFFMLEIICLRDMFLETKWAAPDNQIRRKLLRVLKDTCAFPLVSSVGVFCIRFFHRGIAIAARSSCSAR